MIIKGHQNTESFIDAIAKHISGGGWKRETSGGTGDTICFGHRYWTAEVVYDGADLVGVRLANDDYSNDDIALTEDAISLLEGFTYKGEDEDEEDPEEDPEEDQNPTAPKRPSRRR